MTVGKKKQEAIELFEAFTGHKAKTIKCYPAMDEKVLLQIGRLHAVAYEAVRDNKKTKFYHEFKKNNSPILCVTYCGTQLRIVGGDYIFTEDGITG